EALMQLTTATSPAVAHYNIGYLLSQKGQNSDALRHCQQALAIDPGLTPARELLARLGGNFDAAPMAARPQPQFRPSSVAVQPNSDLSAQRYATVPAAPPAMQTQEFSLPYASGASQDVYTASPQIPVPAQASPPSAFHISDDGPAAQ